MITYSSTASKKIGLASTARGSVIRRNLLSMPSDTEGASEIGKPRGQVDVLNRLMGSRRGGVTEALKQVDRLFPRQNVPVSVGRIRTTSKRTLSFANVYNAAPKERIGVVKNGVDPSMVQEIAAGLSTTTGFVTEILGLKRSTIARKQSTTDAKLSLEDSEKLVGLAKLAGQVEVMLQESGNASGFDTGKWLTEWLNEPMGALGGQKPAQYMDTNEGQAVVSNLLLQVQHGIYA
jgi:putative toxin-antitoxin system antitoxin component (TIGR02293 family)